MNSFFYQQLFKDGIVSLDNEEKRTQTIATISTISTPHIIIIKAIQNAEQDTLLKKIISACQDKEICSLVLDNDFLLIDFQRNSHIETIFFVGYSSLELGMDFLAEKYTIYEFGNMSAIFSDDLNTLLVDEKAKKLLWRTMKDTLEL